MLLHPSRFELWGLVPIYAMRYGTIPIVRRSGGMANSVIDGTTNAIQQETATGFVFEEPSIPELIESVRRTHTLYRLPIGWRKMQTSAMRQDFSWYRSSEAYTNIYRSLIRLPLALQEVAKVEMRARAIA